jgi:scyllo-inositol 2-dehydrogenase (NADP+)
VNGVEPIRVGIAGLGRSGWGIHVRVLGAMPDRYRVVAVTDPSADRRSEAQTALDCQGYAELGQLLADDAVELVVLATPSHLHADGAVRALGAGKHVIVEKPFAADLDGADRMIAAAGAARRVVTCSQNFRYVDDFLAVREVIRSGKLGRILLIRIAWHFFRRRWDWQTLKELGGGTLNNDGSHAIDQALVLLGDVEPEVFCRMERTPLCAGDAEDHVKVILHAPGAPMIDLEFTNACAYPQERWLVMGTRGSLTGGHRSLRWKHFDPAAVPERQVSREPTPDRSYNAERLPWTEEAWELTEPDPRASNKRLYQDLYATLREGAPLAVAAESVRRQISVLERCRELSPV